MTINTTKRKSIHPLSLDGGDTSRGPKIPTKKKKPFKLPAKSIPSLHSPPLLIKSSDSRAPLLREQFWPKNQLFKIRQKALYAPRQRHQPRQLTAVPFSCKNPLALNTSAGLRTNSFQRFPTQEEGKLSSKKSTGREP